MLHALQFRTEMCIHFVQEVDANELLVFTIKLLDYYAVEVVLYICACVYVFVYAIRSVAFDFTMWQ